MHDVSGVADLSWSSVLPFVVAMMAAGALSGVIAGLLGVGGGIILVPVLEWALSVAGVPNELSIKIAVATSLATIIPTGIASSKAHTRRDAVDYRVVRAWAIPIVLGAVAGTLLAARLHGSVLRVVFATVASAVAIKMLLPLDHVILRREVPTSWRASWLPFLIGSVSTLMGIGGGSLSVPTMTLCNQPVHRAVGTSSLLGLWIAVPATLGFLLADVTQLPMPPFNLGYVNYLGFALIAPATWVAAPLGAHMAHRLSRRHLSLVFGAFLMLVALRMIWRSIS